MLEVIFWIIIPAIAIIILAAMYYLKPDEDNDSYQPTMAFSRFRKFYDLAPERFELFYSSFIYNTRSGHITFYFPTLADTRIYQHWRERTEANIHEREKNKRDAIALQVFCEDMEQVIRAKREEAIATAKAEQDKIMQRLEEERRNT